MINLMVLDLSHYDTVTSYDEVAAAGIAGIIYKASQGTGYSDTTYWDSRERALKAGLLWGSYHFGDASDPIKQVQNYIRSGNPKPDELICLDFEDYKSSQMTLPQARNFVTELESQLNRPNQCVIYSGNTLKEALGNKKDPFWAARRLWLAQYGKTPVPQVSWDKPWLWQYTDGEVGPKPHGVNGVDQTCDCNSFDGTPELLKSQWSGGSQSPELPTVTILITTPPGVKVDVIQQ